MYTYCASEFSLHHRKFRPPRYRLHRPQGPHAARDGPVARTTLCCVPLSGLRGRAGSTGLTKCTADPFRNTCSHVPREVLVLVQVRVHVLVVEAAVPRAPIAAVEASRRAPDVIEAAGVAEVRAGDVRALSCLRKRLV